MKLKFLRCGILCIMALLLCIGALFQYMTADKNERTNAILVMLHQN